MGKHTRLLDYLGRIGLPRDLRKEVFGSAEIEDGMACEVEVLEDVNGKKSFLITPVAE